MTNQSYEEKIEAAAKYNWRLKHGKCNLPEYKTWVAARQRCFNKKDAGYKNYGGRGISMCKEWNDFTVFLKDVGRRPTKNHSLDRINNNGNYEPNNCRWTDRRTQNINSRLCFKNKTGFPCVRKNTESHRFSSYFRIGTKRISLGCFDTPEEASTMYFLFKELMDLGIYDDQKYPKGDEK